MKKSFLTAGKFRWTSPLLIFALACAAHGRILHVPADYPTINEAMAVSVADDTILVDRGVYPEQLWFPRHRISVMSRYELTGDTLDVTQTILDGSAYATHDTATIALFLPGAAHGSQLCGFTLTHGHGIGPDGWSGVFLADSCSPIICHNVITGNSSFNSPVGNFFYCSGEFRGNRIFDNTFVQSALRINYNLGHDPVLIEGNYFGPNPSSPAAGYPGIVVNSGGATIIHNNIFRGLTGRVHLAILHFGRSPVITNNVFDSLSVAGWGSSIVMLYGILNVVLSDNVFSNLFSEDGVVMALNGRNRFSLTAEGNLFENITAPGYNGDPAAAGLHVDGFRGTIRNNIFRNNTGATCGAIYLGGEATDFQGGMLLEYNLFQACTTHSPLPDVACIFRGAYRGSIAAHNNIFSANYPRVATVDNILRQRIADFTQNYWGHPSGPYHPLLNPDGLGDTVGDSVLFDPWLTDSIMATPDAPPAWIPARTELTSYPNPFNAAARLTLMVSEPDVYSVKLYSITGQLVRDLGDGAVVIRRDITVTADGLPSGVYFAHAHGRTRSAAATAKLILLR